MRIGELLLESALINAKELDDALYYGRAKALPLGRCLKILRSITEENLTRALEAQKLIRNGLEPEVAVAVLKSACAADITFHEALQKRAKSQSASALPGPTAAAGAPAKFTMAITFPDIPPIAPYQAGRQALDTLQEKKRSAAEFIAEGDQFLMDDRLSDAETSYLTARDLLVSEHGLLHELTAACNVKLANLYLSMDRFGEAEPIYRKVLETCIKLKGPDSMLVAKAHEDIADLLMAKAEYQAAEEAFNTAFRIVESQADLDIAVVGRLLNKLATCLRNINKAGSNGNDGSTKKIGEYCTDAGLLAPDKLQLALQRSKQTGKPLGSVLRSEKFLTPQQLEATLLAQMLTKQEMVPYPVAIRALAVASKANIQLRQLAESGRLVSEARAKEEGYKQLVLEHERLIAAETSLGADHPEVAALATKVGDLVLSRGDRQSALLLFKRAVSILEKSQTVDKLLLASASEKYASILIEDGKLMEAQPLLLRAMELRQASGTFETDEAIGCLKQLAELELQQQNSAPSLSFFRMALALSDKLHPGSCPYDLLTPMAQCLWDLGLVDEAEGLYRRMLTAAQAQYGPFEPETAAYLVLLGDFLVQTGKSSEAQAQYFFAMQIYERSLGTNKEIEELQSKLRNCQKSESSA